MLKFICSSYFDVIERGVVVRSNVHRSRTRVVKIWVSYAVFRSNLMANDDLIDL